LAQFQFRAADAEGKVVEGMIEAAESAAVIARLQDRGLIPIRVGVAAGKVATGRKGPRASRFTARLGQRHLLIVTQELSALLGAGLPLDRSLATLVELADHPELHRILDEVMTAVRGGKSLGDSLAEHKFFPSLYVNMVRAGEVGGFLDSALERLADYLERSQDLRREVVTALTYPSILTLVLASSLIFLLIYVLPRFSALFEGMGRALPLPAQIVMGTSNFLRAYWWVGVLIGLGSSGSAAGRRRRRGGCWDQTKLKIAGLGMIIRKMEVSGVTRTLGTLIKSGVPMIQALVTARAVVGNVVISNALGDVEVGVREGAGVSKPLARSGAFPALAVQMISVGEETGKLDDMLLRVAEHYDKEVRAQVMQFTRLLEPMMIVVMGLLVGGVVVSMLTAIFSINDLPM
jgi:general secretion pathway protein F